jgi:6-phosphogluconate dehydrogenase
MGRNLLLNVADHGFSVVGLSSDPIKAAALEKEAAAGQHMRGTTSTEDFVRLLRRPRAVMLLVPAGNPVDETIQNLLPHLEPGDVIIDGGNSYFADTDRRVAALSASGVHFFGMGVSGGEKGARFGPSMMPGGDRQAYERLRPIFEAIAAKVDGEPCVTYLGSGSAGHYVKMIHNGIEYGIMQLIAETYDLMKRGLGLDDQTLQRTFDEWNRSELQSFLIEITAQVLRKQDNVTGELLVNLISDRARQKGTGKWTSANALDLQVPIPTIDVAVAMRNLSAYRAERGRAAGVLASPTAHTHINGDRQTLVNRVRNALYFAMITTYAQGMALLRTASETYGYGLQLGEVARIWRGGCIIRAASLEDIRRAYEKQTDLPNLLLDPVLASQLLARQADTRATVKLAVDAGIPMPALLTSLSYFDAYRSSKLPTNLIQAQRDFFGAHTFERVDREGVFHADWE